MKETKATIPTDAHRIAKAGAALKGVKIREWIADAIREKAEREGKK